MTSDISHLLPPFCCLSLCSSQTLRCKDKQFVSLSGEGSYRCFVDRNKHGWSICCLSLLVQASYSSSLSTPPPILSSNHSSREQWQSAAFTHSFTSPVIVRKHSTNTLAELSKLQIYLRCCSTHTHTTTRCPCRFYKDGNERSATLFMRTHAEPQSCRTFWCVLQWSQMMIDGSEFPVSCRVVWNNYLICKS